jgi:hypothetical protein
MDDPINAAFIKAQANAKLAQDKGRLIREKSDEALSQVLPPLKEQIMSALKSAYFDGGVQDETPAQLNATRSAVGRLEIVATRRSAPFAQVKVSVDINYTYADPPQKGTYGRLEASGQFFLTPGQAATFPVQIGVNHDGSVKIDAEAMKTVISKFVGG